MFIENGFSQDCKITMITCIFHAWRFGVYPQGDGKEAKEISSLVTSDSVSKKNVLRILVVLLDVI